MARTETVTVYQFDELSADAKEKAREWWRKASEGDEWWGATYEDAERMAAILGITIDTKHGHGPAIYFSGFWSQGDGACFEGRYAYAPGSVQAIKAEAPKDKTLHAIAEALYRVQRPHGYGLTARVSNTGNSSHEYATLIDVFKGDEEADAETAGHVADALRDFMRWIYRSLETEWEYQNADEQVDENIRANEYDFTADGKRWITRG
jgi:hypothetical protein